MADTVPSVLPTDLSNGTVDAFRLAAGKGQDSQGISLTTFLVSLAGASAIFGVEFAAFILLKNKLKRI